MDRLVGEKQLMKLIFGTLGSPEPLIYSTACVIIGQLLKYFKEKKKEKAIEATLSAHMQTLLDNFDKFHHVIYGGYIDCTVGWSYLTYGAAGGSA